jgi:hypothetical protein
MNYNPLQLAQLLKRIGIIPVNMIPVTYKKVIKKINQNNKKPDIKYIL